MAKSNITKNNSEFDLLTEIEKSPQLTNYVIRTKVSETRKTAIIIALIAVFLAFIGGVVVGLNMTKLSSPQNVIEVQVSNTGETAPEGK